MRRSINGGFIDMFTALSLFFLGTHKCSPGLRVTRCPSLANTGVCMVSIR